MSILKPKEIESLQGRNIYHDNKNRTIYFDRFTKKGYVLRREHFRTYSNYTFRFILPIVAFLLFSGTIFEKPLLNIPHSFLISVLLAVGIFTFLTYRFYWRFLPSLTILPRFVPGKKKNFFASLQQQSPMKITIRIILFFLLGTLFILNANQLFAENANRMNLYAGWLLSAGSFLYGLLNLLSLAFRKKQPKE